MLKRLRHPVRAIREPFGTAGLIVACVALIAALGGTALAAANLNSTQKKEVEKIAKKYAGKPGAAGPAGPTGSTGPAGAAGAGGKDGANGTNGSPGTNGKSIVTIAITTSGLEGHCVSVGGTRVEVEGNTASRQYICNGAPGTTGFTETLPSGKTETGVWAFGEVTTGSKPPSSLGVLRYPLSFSIPLSGSLAASKVHFINEAGLEVTGLNPGEEQVSTVCTGSVTSPTVAEAGNLCVYTGELEQAISTNGNIKLPSSNLTSGAGTTGAVLRFQHVNEEAGGFGTWAVKAP